jgi:outer membrane protein insertion porin family
MTDVFGPRTSMTYRVWNTSGPDFYGDLFPNINTMRVGWDVALSRPFADYYSNTLSFGSETVRAWSTEDDTTTSTDSFEAYMSDFLGYALSYDTRDFWMNPTEGKYYSFSVREGWKKTAITTNYTKFGVDLNEFLKIAQSQVLALHSGFGIGFGDVPFGEYYWCGGANTVRGYGPSEARLGIKKVILNAEYRYTFNEVFQAVLFYDFGTVWGDIVNRMTAGQDPDYTGFMSGRGFGIRLNTPLGPIRLDYGIGDKKAFGEGILHFSIGHAF